MDELNDELTELSDADPIFTHETYCPQLANCSRRPESARNKRFRELGMYDEIKGLERERAQMRRELK